MNSYTNRAGEFQSMLADMLAASEREGHAEGAAERNQASARIAEYISARNRSLDELDQAAGAMCSNPGNADGSWRRPLESLAESAGRVLGGMLTGIANPGKSAQAFAWSVHSQESGFARALQGLDMAGYLVRIDKLRLDIESMDAALQAKWQALVDKSASLDDAQGALASQLKQALMTAQSCAQSRSAASGDRLRTVMNELERLSNDSGQADWHERSTRGVESGCTSAAQAYRDLGSDGAALMAAAATARASIQALRGLQEAETSAIHRLFQDARNDAAQFCRQSAADLAAAALQECRDALNRTASGMPTSAQQADAHALAADMLARAEPLTAAVQKAFEQFKNAHAGRFLGEISSATMEALAHPGAWAGRRGWEADVQRTLGDCRTQAEQHWQVRLNEPCQKLASANQARLDAAERTARDAADKRRARDDRLIGARTELLHYLVTDADLDAFTSDFYRDVRNQYWEGITRPEKMNILLDSIGVDTVLNKAREYYEWRNPFNKDDLPTKRTEYAVRLEDREVLLATLKSDADFEAFALDFYRRAFDEFTGSMTRRQKAALLLSHFPGSEVLAKAQQYYGKLHPFDERKMPTRPGRYPATEYDRDRLLALLKTDVDLEAFALDNFKHAFDDFSSGMDTLQKAGLILIYYGASAVFATLKEHLDAKARPR